MAGNGSRDSDTSVVVGTGVAGVAVTLEPGTVEAGPGSTALFTMTVQNLGSVAQIFNLSHELPTGWTGRFEANGQSVSSVAVATGLYSQAELSLLVTPVDTEVNGSFPVSITATSQSSSAITGSDQGLVNLSGQGVQVEILDRGVTFNPEQSYSWDIRLTNTGTAGSDSFDLAAAGIVVGANGAFSADQVTLSQGASTIVQYTAGPFTGALPQEYDFSIVAQSQGNAAVLSEDRTTFTLASAEAIDVRWDIATRTVTDTFTVEYVLLLTNTGNVATEFDIGLSGNGLAFEADIDQLYLPPGMAASIPVRVNAAGPGTFTFTGSAAGVSSQASDEATFIVNATTTNNAPFVNAGDDIAVLIGQPVAFNGSFSDPDGPEPHQIRWEFGDGATAAGTLTPSHAYSSVGEYTVTLIVSDDLGNEASDTLTVTVDLPKVYLPTLMSRP